MNASKKRGEHHGFQNVSHRFNDCSCHLRIQFRCLGGDLFKRLTEWHYGFLHDGTDSNGTELFSRKLAAPPITLRTYLCGPFSPPPGATLAGSNLISTLAITKGWCSPALPTNVYDRSNSVGPRVFISQSSFSREPARPASLPACH
jgi:hypothetical protein